MVWLPSPCSIFCQCDAPQIERLPTIVSLFGFFPRKMLKVTRGRNSGLRWVPSCLQPWRWQAVCFYCTTTTAPRKQETVDYREPKRYRTLLDKIATNLGIKKVIVSYLVTQGGDSPLQESSDI